MKSLVIALSVLSLTFAPVKKADAGIILVSSGGVVGVLGGAVLITGSSIPLFMGLLTDGFGAPGAGTWYLGAIALIVADEDTSNVAEVVLEKYPTIAPYAADELQYMINEKANEINYVDNDVKEITFSEAEARSIIELTEESSEADKKALFDLMTKKSSK